MIIIVNKYTVYFLVFFSINALIMSQHKKQYIKLHINLLVLYWIVRKNFD